MKKVVATSAAPAAIGPYSQAIAAGGLLFVSGQIPLVPSTGALIAGNIDVQTVQVLDNLKAIVEAAGTTLANAVKTTVYLADINDFARVNEIYATYFPKSPPARVCVEVSNLPKGALIEIDLICAMKINAPQNHATPGRWK